MSRVTYASIVLSFNFLYLFSLVFPFGRKSIVIFSKLVVGASFILAFLTLFSTFIAKDIKIQPWGFDIITGELYYYLFLPLVIVLIILTSVNFIKRYKKSVGIHRAQLQYFLLGLAIFSLMEVIFNVVVPIITGNQQYYNIGNASSIFFVIFTAIAIVRYRLMDIKVVIRKGLVYGLSLIISFALYTYLAILIKNFLQNTLNLSENWGIFVLVALVALGFPPLKYGVEKLINIAFFPKAKNLKKKAREITKEISSKIKLEDLINKFAKEIKENILVTNLKVYLKDRKTGDFKPAYPQGISDLIKYEDFLANYFKINQEILITEEIDYLKENENEAKVKVLDNLKKVLESRNIALVIPLQNLSEELDVLIFLENKKNKDAFNLEDINFLQNISSQLNIALANAILYKEAVERIEM